MSDLDKLIDTLNAQKGAQIALQSLLVSVLRSLPPGQLSETLSVFDDEVEIARSTLGNTPIPDEVIEGFENQVAALNSLRRPT